MGEGGRRRKGRDAQHGEAADEEVDVAGEEPVRVGTNRAQVLQHKGCRRQARRQGSGCIAIGAGLSEAVGKDPVGLGEQLRGQLAFCFVIGADADNCLAGLHICGLKPWV